MSISFVALFILGMLLQTFLSVDFFKNPKKNLLTIIKSTSLALIFPIISLLIVQKELRHLQYVVSLVMWGVFFCLCIMVFFKDEIVPALNESSLLVINLVTLYLILKSHLPFILALIYFLISLTVLINALVPHQLKRWQEMWFLAWYFILTVTIPIAHFNFVELYTNFSGKVVNFSLASPLAFGMVISFVIMHLWFLFWFIPYKGRPKEEIKGFFTSKYDETIQLTPLTALLLMGAVAGLLSANYYFEFIPDSFMIILTLVLSSFFGRKKPLILAN